MLMKVIKIIISLIILTPLVGCWDSKAIKEIQTIGTFGIDKIGDKYEVSVEIVKAYELIDSERNEATTVVYSAVGDTISSAYHKMNKKILDYPFLGHINGIVIGKSAAEDGVDKILDTFFRNVVVRSDPHVFLVEDYSAKDVLSIIPDVIKVTSYTLLSKSKNSLFKYGASVPIILREVKKIIPLKGQELFIPLIKVNTNDKEKGYTVEKNKKSLSDTYFELDGIGLFRDNKLVGVMTDVETKGFVIIKKIQSNSPIIINYRNCNVVCDITVDKSEIDIVYDKKPKIKILSSIKGDIIEMNCSNDLTDIEILDEMNKIFEKEIKTIMSNSIKKSQSLGSDIFGFGEMVRRYDSKKWLEIKDNWSEIYKTLDIDITVDFIIDDTGTLSDYLSKEE